MKQGAEEVPSVALSIPSTVTLSCPILILVQQVLVNGAVPLRASFPQSVGLQNKALPGDSPRNLQGRT